MKKNIFLFACLGLFLGFSAHRVGAQVFASDSAAPYTAWNTGTNYGFGFGPWVQYQTGTGNGSYTGFFLGDGGDAIASPNGQAWGIYANGAGTPASEAFRTFSNSLPVNATFKILWHNKGIGGTTSNDGGFNLRNGDNTNLQAAASILSDGSLFSFYYIGGISDNYDLYDGNGVTALPISFSQGSSGLQIQFTLLPDSSYNLLIENAAGTEVLWSTNDQPLAASGTIDSIACYALDTSDDQDFNSMEIYDAAPEVINLQPANGSVYDAAGGQLSFDVTSAASTVVSNQIQLTLDGVLQTGNDWTVYGSGTSSNAVVVNTPLEQNQVYNGTVVVTDQSGNTATNTFTFNTWVPSPDNIYIEASDYNYSGGDWINNFLTPQPNQLYGQNDLTGEQGIDYSVYNLAETNNTNPYRAGDAPYLEASTDVDHNNFANDGFTPYDLAYNEPGQWEDYTRQLSNSVTYAVYARMAGFPGGTVSFERMASQEVSSTNQPGAVLGTFVCPDTGGVQDWAFVPLHDFFSNPVLINSGGTNTFRITDVNGSGTYNLSYMILVAVTNSATIRPYLASGFPYPGATGVSPAGQLSFTIANGQTSVDPASIELLLNSNDVTASLVVSNDAAGATVTYQNAYPNLFGSNNTATVIFSDGSVWQTDTWQFTSETLPALPTSWALPLNSDYARGFAEEIAKGDDSATNIDFPPNVARAEAQLAGVLTNSLTGLPYTNEALNGGVYDETNTINYAIDPNFFGLFAPTNAFPDVPPGTTNNVALAANMYVYLTPGVYNFDVYSDDGFQFSAGTTPASTNIILGAANYGRGATGTEFSFIVNAAGLYPMQLIYFKAQEGGGGVELYSINNTGVDTLLNAPDNANAVPVYYLVSGAPTLSISRSGSSVTLTWTAPGYSLESASTLTAVYTVIPSATSPYTVPASGSQQYFRLVKSP